MEFCFQRLRGGIFCFGGVVEFFVSVEGGILF